MQPIFREPKLASKPGPARRPRFSPKLLNDERFIDPARELQLLLPQQQVSTQLRIEPRQAQALSAKERRQSFIAALYDQVLAWLTWVKKKFKGGRRARQRLTLQGEQALEQLRYLSLLCDATEARTPEEVLAAESAFGEAYYEIMGLSSNLSRMSQKEQGHHIARYQKYMSSLLRATD
ncbi:Uncharacterised protein [uncultured archaeon]|nr:Uncharacterised protein [uncultured archaeon]